METINKIKSKIGREKHFTRPGTWELDSISKGQKRFREIGETILAVQGKEYQFTPVQNIINAFIYWTYTVKGSSQNINQLKGIIIKGYTGAGKTFLFETFRYFLEIDKPFFDEKGERKRILPRLVSAKRIAGEYSLPDTGGYQVIQKYANYSCLCIDDIGAEALTSNNFGNSLNVVAEILNIREEKGLLTFGTTNLEKFSDVYDDRTVSRINSLFNILALNHTIDFRKV